MENPNSSVEPLARPLAGIRILDFCNSAGQSCGRFLSDLGADVILVEPTGGVSGRSSPPMVGPSSLRFMARNAGKQSIEISSTTPDWKAKVDSLIAAADAVIIAQITPMMEDLGVVPDQLRESNPELIVLQITDFGCVGPYKDYIATNSVHAAMGAVLARSGIDGLTPLLPPGEIAIEAASIQAAWVMLLALRRRMLTGQGDYLDFSINDAIAQILDPGAGATGSAAAGKSAFAMAARGRPSVTAEPGKPPSVALLYPIFRCSDGQIRLCVLSPRHWDAISAWIGPNHPYQDPKYGQLFVRIGEIGDINKLFADFFANQDRDALLREAKERGIPMAPISKPGELFEDQHFSERDLFQTMIVSEHSGLIPKGYVHINGRRCGLRAEPPGLGTTRIEDVLAKHVEPSGPNEQNPTLVRQPLEHLVVLDLGVIVAGAELGRLFADQGAKVIKVENSNFPDGLRQSAGSGPISPSFSLASRGKQSLGLNLRSEKGKDLFRELVRQADIVVSNFKPGTMDSLGFSYAELSAINPKIICAESSAMGSSGPAAQTMGYGPLVRALTSLSGLWRYPDMQDGFADTTTIFPDHFAARVSATTILAMLIEREKTGRGGFIDVSQAEVIINALAPEFLRESITPGSLVAKGNQFEFDAPNSIFQCKGDDEWCAISVTDSAQWESLCRAMDQPELAEKPDYATCEDRIKHQSELERHVAAWCASRTPYEIMDKCQSEGVPAGNMLRLSEFPDNPHYKAREFLRELNQPTIEGALLTENGPVALNENYSPPTLNPAPLVGEHTRALMKDLMGLSDNEIDHLIETGDLEEWTA